MKNRPLLPCLHHWLLPADVLSVGVTGTRLHSPLTTAGLEKCYSQLATHHGYLSFPQHWVVNFRICLFLCVLTLNSSQAVQISTHPDGLSEDLRPGPTGQEFRTWPLLHRRGAQRARKTGSLAWPVQGRCAASQRGASLSERTKGLFTSSLWAQLPQQSTGWAQFQTQLQKPESQSKLSSGGKKASNPFSRTLPGSFSFKILGSGQVMWQRRNPCLFSSLF